MTRAREVAQRRLARVLRGRKEPHGKDLTDESILRGVDVDDSGIVQLWICLLYTSPSPRDATLSRMPSSA